MGFAEPSLAMKLQQFDRIDGDIFNWRLNDTVLVYPGSLVEYAVKDGLVQSC